MVEGVVTVDGGRQDEVFSPASTSLSWCLTPPQNGRPDPPLQPIESR